MAYLTIDDTIAAIASPTGGGRRGVVRVSGPNVAQVVAESFAFDDSIDLRAAKRASRFTGSMKLAENLPALHIALLARQSQLYTPTIS